MTNIHITMPLCHIRMHNIHFEMQYIHIDMHYIQLGYRNIHFTINFQRYPHAISPYKQQFRIFTYQKQYIIMHFKKNKILLNSVFASLREIANCLLRLSVFARNNKLFFCVLASLLEIMKNVYIASLRLCEK